MTDEVIKTLITAAAGIVTVIIGGWLGRKPKELPVRRTTDRNMKQLEADRKAFEAERAAFYAGISLELTKLRGELADMREDARRKDERILALEETNKTKDEKIATMQTTIEQQEREITELRRQVGVLERSTT